MIRIAIVVDEKVTAELMGKYVKSQENKRGVKVAKKAFYNAESFDFT